MAKKFVISTGRVNSYGSRVITSGIDVEQFRKNPILLYMHQRGTLPIGRVEDVYLDGDKLIGTPVFDENDSFAKQVADKWERGFLNMCSAGIDILETSVDPVHLMPGQTRATVLRSKLNEVSIVDIEANDDALKLAAGGKLLTLAAGEACDALPLLELAKDDNPADGKEPEANNNTNQFNMKKETLELLGLTEGASEQQVHEAVQLLKGQADKAATMELAAITAAVDQAVTERRITEGKREHFMTLGKTAGVQALKDTLELMQPAQKPLDTIHQETGANGAPAGQPATYAKLSEVPTDKLEALKAENPAEYAKLYKAEYGIDLPTV